MVILVNKTGKTILYLHFTSHFTKIDTPKVHQDQILLKLIPLKYTLFYKDHIILYEPYKLLLLFLF